MSKKNKTTNPSSPIVKKTKSEYECYQNEQDQNLLQPDHIIDILPEVPSPSSYKDFSTFTPLDIQNADKSAFNECQRRPPLGILNAQRCNKKEPEQTKNPFYRDEEYVYIDL